MLEVPKLLSVMTSNKVDAGRRKPEIDSRGQRQLKSAMESM